MTTITGLAISAVLASGSMLTATTASDQPSWLAVTATPAAPPAIPAATSADDEETTTAGPSAESDDDGESGDAASATSTTSDTGTESHSAMAQADSEADDTAAVSKTGATSSSAETNSASAAVETAVVATEAQRGSTADLPSNAKTLIPSTAAGLITAASLQPGMTNVDLPMRPSISPDGSEIVFTWGGDLWKVSSEGGQALRITSHPGDDLTSAWSHDGERIAFVSDRDGYWNIHTMNADGSDIVQVTNLDATHDLSGFGVCEDGNEVLLFAGRLEGDVYRSDRPYMVPVDGGMAQRVHDAFGDHPVVSPDGRHVVFTRGASDWDRRHYRGPDNRNVFLYDRDTDEFTQLTEWEGNDGRARFLDNDTVLYLSDRSLDTVNLYRRDLNRDERNARRLTSFREIDVQDFDVSHDGTTAVLHVWDRLYTLDLTDRDAEPREVVMYAPEDQKDTIRLQNVNREVSEAALSPDEQVMAYVAYGEIFIRNVDDMSPTIRVTNTPAREQGIVWSPDGLKLYFVNDADGTESIHAATVALTRSELKEDFERLTGIQTEEEADTGTEAETDDGAETSGTAADAVSGNWSGEARAPGGEVIGFTLTLELAENARDVSGSISAMGFLGEVTGTWNFAARQLQLAGTIDMGPTITMDVTVDGNSFSGSANAGGAPYDVTATREVTEQVNTANPAADGDGNGDGEETDADASDAKEKDEAEEEVPKEFDPKRWHDAIRFNIEPVVADSEHNDRQPSPSPNGEHLAFRRGNGNLMVHDFATDETRLLVPGWDASIGWRWRPDSKLIAYDQNDLNFNSDVWIVPADGSADPVNITRHPDSDSSPRWSADGKVLTFTSEREDESWNLYRVYLDKDLEALSPKELTAYYDEAVKDARKRSPIEVKMPDKEDEDEGEGEEKADGQGEDAAEGDTESKSGSTSEKEDPATDFDDAYLRLSMVVRDSVAGWQNELTPGGDRLIFSSGGLQSVKWDGSDRKSLGGGSIQHLNLTGDKLVAVSGGRAGVVNPNGGSMNYYDIDYTLRIDLNEESSQKFLEAARVVGERFYHPTMKGLDWKALSERYHDLARRARTSTEFNAIANRLLGELNGSHLGIRTPDDTVSDIRQSHGRLGTRHHRVDKGFEVTEIIPESPAAKGAMALKVGDIITAVDFESLGRTDTIEARLEGKVNEEVVLTIHRTLEEGEDPVELNLFITPISSGRERALLYDHWVLENKRLVDEWSNGRLGYVHVQGMNQPSLNVFERDLYAAADGKDGLLVDVRNNGGGWTADRLLASITVQPHAYTIPRDADPSMTGYYPQDRLFIQRYTLPMNMLANEKSFSNAEIVSHAFKTLNRGNLVGQQTYGGVISTGGTRLLDGTFVRIPFRGWFLPDGTDMENNGAMPDVLVPQTPESEASNDDIQLRAAVEDLLKRLD